MVERRAEGLDRWRGLAVLLMVLDHAAAFIPGPVALGWRLSGGRVALPIFCILLGLFLNARSNTPLRGFYLVAGGLLLSSASAYTHSPLPRLDILVNLGACILARRWIIRYPIVVLVVGMVEGYTFGPVYSGYSFGHVAALVAVGTILSQPSESRTLRGLNASGMAYPSFVGYLGRHALTAYYFQQSGFFLLSWALTGPGQGVRVFA